MALVLSSMTICSYCITSASGVAKGAFQTNRLGKARLGGTRTAHHIIHASSRFTDKWELGTSLKKEVAELSGGNGKGGDDGSGKNNGRGGGGNSDDEGPNMDPEIKAILIDANRTVSSFPGDFSSALVAGKVAKEILQRYLTLERNFLMGFLFKIPSMRHRLLADPYFLFKVGVECGIGIFTKSTAEYNKRKDTFWKELDFVTANVIMALIADFMLVFLPAPTLVYNRASKSKNLFSWFDLCPDNAFQMVQKNTRDFTLAQRFGAVIRNGAKLFAVGLTSSFIGVGITNTLLKIRESINPALQTDHPPQNILMTSLGYGTYMSVSSNLRYQMVAGVIEERGIERIFATNPTACKTLSFIARTINTYIGSLLWVDFLRITGIQKKRVDPPKPEPMLPSEPIAAKANTKNKRKSKK